MKSQSSLIPALRCIPAIIDSVKAARMLADLEVGRTISKVRPFEKRVSARVKCCEVRLFLKPDFLRRSITLAGSPANKAKPDFAESAGGAKVAMSRAL